MKVGDEINQEKVENIYKTWLLREAYEAWSGYKNQLKLNESRGLDKSWNPKVVYKIDFVKPKSKSKVFCLKGLDFGWH